MRIIICNCSKCQTPWKQNHMCGSPTCFPLLFILSLNFYQKLEEFATTKYASLDKVYFELLILKKLQTQEKL